MNDAPNKLAMTATEIAPLVGVDAEVLTAAAKRGEIPARRLRKRWLFNLEALRIYFSDPSPARVERPRQSSKFYPIRGMVGSRLERRRAHGQQ